MERVKAFEIKKPTSSNKTIRMPDDLIDQLDLLAKEKDISFNKLVVQCCEFALANLDERSAEEKTNGQETENR